MVNNEPKVKPIKNNKLMKYFTKTEVIRCYSENKTGRCKECRLSHAIKVLPDGIEANMIALVDNVLDPAREELGKPVIVTSPYRCPYKNNLVGSKPTSQHLKCEACDVTVGTPEENLKLAKIIYAQGKFDQLILYVHPGSMNPQFLHVSYKRNGDNRHRILKQVIGTAGYSIVTNL